MLKNRIYSLLIATAVIGLLTFATFGPFQSAARTADTMIYDDQLTTGWFEAGYNRTVDLG